MRTKTILILVTLALLFGACGSDDDSSATTSSETSTTDDGDTTTSDGTTSSSTSTSATSSSTTATSSSTSVTTIDPSQTTLPGEDIFSFAKDGDVIAVFGVADDDVLNVRALPGADQDVVATAAPTADDLVAKGRARSLPNSIWYEVSIGATTGWVNSSFVAFMGGTDDATAEYLETRDRPVAETMTDLGEIVAEELGSEDPKSLIVQSVAPSVGDLGEVTYDVVGIGDDSVRGFRLHIFEVEGESGETFELRTIERTTFCFRGLAGELCV